MNECPYCNAVAIDVTIHGDDFDQRPKYMCIGPDQHRWRDGEGPMPMPAEGERLIIVARG